MANYWKEARAQGVPWAWNVQDGVDRLPVKLFGDDARYGARNGEQIYAVYISCPLFRPRCARQSRWLIWSLRSSLFLGEASHARLVTYFFVKLTFKFQHLLKEFDFQTSTGYETLQPVMARIVWSMRLVAARFMITEISGDWKYLRQLFNFSTHWNGLHICHFCRVRKTEYADLSMPEWRTTREFLLEALPDTPSPLILLPCFDVSMIQICQLHSLNLGLLWTCNGSTICYLMEAGMFGDPRLGLHELLERVHSDFLIWATENRIRHSQRKFTPALLIKKQSGAYCTTKGHNSQIITEYLTHCCLTIWEQQLPVVGRILGQWLHSQGKRLDDAEFLAPTALALILILSHHQHFCLWLAYADGVSFLHFSAACDALRKPLNVH